MVTIHIQGLRFPNTLVDLGDVKNIIILETCALLRITTLKRTPTMMELVGRSVVKSEGTLDDIIIFVDSWEYRVDFLVLNPTNKLEGNTLILGRSWLTTIDVYIRC